MIRLTEFTGKRIAVFGLGRSGLMAARALVDVGAHVFAWDDNAPPREAADQSEIPLHDLHALDWTGLDMLVLAPGVPVTHPEPHWTVKAAIASNIPITSDIELFLQQRAGVEKSAPFIGITGTNGKSTTTALIAHLLNAAGYPADAGGNIGIPILKLPSFEEQRISVIECSSFQIDITPSLAPDIGVLLNLSPDHLDRHGTMENYAAVKRRLLEKSAHGVIGLDDAFCREIYTQLRDAGLKTTTISADINLNPDILYGSGEIQLKDGNIYQKLINLNEVYTLRGDHNLQNAAAATAVLLALGIEKRQFLPAFFTFAGLSHRMELVARLGRILFINDSKATNADAASKALSSFEPIYWIAGGRPKTDGIDALLPLFPRIKKAFLIGEAEDRFAHTLKGHVESEKCVSLDTAVSKAFLAAKNDGAKEPAIVFSPACASFDQYPNFEVRGDAFRKIVEQIPGVTSDGEA